MYVCVCKAVTNNQITQAINQGVCSRRQLMQCTGAGSVCGKCSRHIKELVDERLRLQSAAQAA
ncbi:MAG: (2Fe-2S)-binding protein [Methylococcaceae bacterium]|nr:(2Fe-2S)-binding protein [Methylococcaceae bacterium]